MNAVLRKHPEARFLAVGEHVIDMDTLRLVTTPGEPRLTPKAAAVLLRFAQSAGRTLSRDELLNEVWKGTCPTPDVLTQAVKELRRVLGDDPHAPRFLETLPRLGYRLVASARFLDEFETSKATRAAGYGDAALPQRVAGSKVWRGALAALAAAALAAIAAPALLAVRERGAAPGQPRWHASEQRSITADPGPENFPRISPDGTRVAYSVGDVARREMHIVQRSLAQSRVVRLTQPAAGEEFYPVWSPDGATIAFARQDGDDCSILAVPALGGPEKLIGRCFPGSVNYFSWTPDGRHLVTTAPSAPDAGDLAILRVPVDGGEADRLAYARDAADIDLDARYSPDGSRIAFRRGANPYSDLFVVDAHGGTVRQITHLASRMRGFDWTRDGSALIFSSGHQGPQALYVVSLDDGSIEPLGVQPAEFPSAARASDTIVYEIPRLRTRLSAIDVEAGGGGEQDLAPSTGNDGAPAFSPVDDRLAFVSDRSGSQQLWLADHSETFPLTESDTPTLRYPAWRADGARILVTARGESKGHLVEIDIATRRRRVLTAPDDDVRSGVYGPGQDSFIAVVGSGRECELILFGSASGSETSRRVLARGVARADYDRNADAIYFTKINETGLFALDRGSTAERRVSSTVNAAHLDGWLLQGGRIFYIEALAVGPSKVREVDPATGEDRVVATIPESIADMGFSVSHDGRRVVVVRVAAPDTDVGALTLRRAAAG
ncbi:MAG TPA: winged helix-turn-helix domain-containing protein [Rhodanobacteraceae bacterium]|nr:winged helix-turn-helix domain-containing protein [Rhodanobacteraceae bacterium]